MDTLTKAPEPTAGNYAIDALTPVIPRTKPWSENHPSVRLIDRDGDEMDTDSPLLGRCVASAVENTLRFPWYREKSDGELVARNGGTWLNADHGAIIEDIARWYDRLGNPRRFCVDLEPHNCCPAGYLGQDHVNNPKLTREYAFRIGDLWDQNLELAAYTMSQFSAITGAEVLAYDPLRMGYGDLVSEVCDRALVPAYIRKDMGPNDWPEFARSLSRRMNAAKDFGVEASPIVFPFRVDGGRAITKDEMATVKKIVAGVAGVDQEVFVWCPPTQLDYCEQFIADWARVG